MTKKGHQFFFEENIGWHGKLPHRVTPQYTLHFSVRVTCFRLFIYHVLVTVIAAGQNFMKWNMSSGWLISCVCLFVVVFVRSCQTGRNNSTSTYTRTLHTGRRRSGKNLLGFQGHWGSKVNVMQRRTWKSCELDRSWTAESIWTKTCTIIITIMHNLHNHHHLTLNKTRNKNKARYSRVNQAKTALSCPINRYLQNIANLTSIT